MAKKVPSNPELVHVPEVADRTRAAQGGLMLSTVHHESAPVLKVGAGSDPEGAVYVTHGVPDLLCEVLPGQHVRVPEDHPSPPGDYFGDDPEHNQFVTQGPTAHMLEARGIVKVLAVAGDNDEEA